MAEYRVSASSEPASTSAATSDATPRCGSATTSPTTRGGGVSALPICLTSMAPNSTLHLDFAVDTQTSPLVPTRGFRLRSTLRQYFEAPTASSTLNGVELQSPQSFTSGEVRTSWFRASERGGDRLFVIGEGGELIRRIIRSSTTSRSAVRCGSARSTTISCVATTTCSFGGGYLRGVGRMPDVLGGSIFLGAWVEGGVGLQRLGQSGLEERHHRRGNPRNAARPGVRRRQRRLPGRAVASTFRSGRSSSRSRVRRSAGFSRTGRRAGLKGLQSG